MKVNEKCKHKWVDMEDGSLDQFCVRCRKFQMRAIMKPIQAELSAPLSVPLSAPIMRETMEVPFYNGSEHTRITVDKEKFLEEMNERIYRQMGLPGYMLNDMT